MEWAVDKSINQFINLRIDKLIDKQMSFAINLKLE